MRIPVESGHDSGRKAATVPFGIRPTFRFGSGHCSGEFGPTARKLSQPDWQELHDELATHKSLTLMLLWQEYKAGEKFFVDYSGQKVPIVDPASGEVREAELFVGVMGASNFTYAEATWTQSLADWTGSHVRAFAFMGGVAMQTIIVCNGSVSKGNVNVAPSSCYDFIVAENTIILQ